MMNTTPNNAVPANPNRRDPLTQVVDFDCLEVAYELMVRQQNVDYWFDVKTPRAPDGAVPNEALRQVLVFALPLLTVAGGFAAFGHMGALYAAVPAVLVGYAQDVMLKRAIKAQRAVDENLDRGRFRASLFLANRLGLTVEEITLVRIRKMVEDYLVQKPLREAALLAKRKREAAARAAKPSRWIEDDVETTGRGNRTGAGSNRTHGGTNGGYLGDRFAPFGANMTGVNPVTGLPMAGNGSVVDVGGNVFGTDNA